MLPYEPPAVTEKLELAILRFRRSRKGFWTCAFVTAVSMPMATVPIATLIDQTFQPTMSIWIIPYFLLILMFCIPIGLASALIARWTRRFVSSSPILSLMLTIVMALLPFVMVPALKNTETPLLGGYALMLLWTSGAPLFLGMTAYLCITIDNPPHDDGQWPAPHHWEQ